VCSQLSQPDENTRQINERQEGLGEFVVAGGDTSEVFDAGEETFDQIAFLLEMAIEIALGEAIGARRDHRLRTCGFDH
jgi:hypothetical protein